MEGWTCLHHAAYYGHRAAVELLLEAGADPSARDQCGKTAAELTRQTRYAELADFLEQEEEGRKRSECKRPKRGRRRKLIKEAPAIKGNKNSLNESFSEMNID